MIVECATLIHYLYRNHLEPLIARGHAMPSKVIQTASVRVVWWLEIETPIAILRFLSDNTIENVISVLSPI